MVTAIWPPTGIALAALLGWGRSAIPGVLLGAFLLNAWSLGTPDPAMRMLAAGAIAFGNTMGAVIAWIALRGCGFDRALHRVSDIMYLVLAAGAGALFTATNGLASLVAFNHTLHADWSGIWCTWFIGDALGFLSVTPALLGLSAVWTARRSLPLPFLLTVAVALAVAFDPVFCRQAPTAYVTILPLLWVGARGGGPALAVAQLAIALLLMVGTAQGRGPFSVYPQPSLALCTFLAFVTTIALGSGVINLRWRELLETARDGEVRLRRFVEGLPMGAMHVEGDRLLFNPALERLIGWSNRELSGLDLFFTRVFGDEAAAMRERYRADRERGFPDRWRVRAQHRSGTPIEIEVAAHREGGADILVIQDLTERIAAEATVRRLQDQLLDAIEALDAGFVMYDAEQKLVVCNSTYRRMYHRSAPAMEPGTSYEDILRLGASLGSHVASGLDGEAWIRHHLDRLRRGQGSEEQAMDERWIRIDDRPTRDGGVVSLRTDITELKHIETDLRLARDAAEAGTRAKDDFLATMSHEIRTPLNGVIGMAQLLRRTELDAQQQDHLDTLLLCADNLLSLINGILDFTKIEAGAMHLERARVDPRQLTDDAVRMVAIRARDKGIEVVWKAADGVPRRIIGDPTRLQQVLLNLLMNAVKFTDAGRITVVLSCVDGLLSIAITDTGIGMDADTIGRLFTPFAQADSSTTRRFGGTGLGLAICKRLVELMGGTITVESRPGGGSTFTVRLPTDAVSSGQRPIATEEESAATFTGLVLVVEDDATNRLIARHLLTAHGLTVELVDNGASAIERLAHAPLPDLVLMDCQMPGIDGYESTRRLRAAGVRLPIIAMTANALAGDREECLAAGMDDYLSKPFAEDSLLVLLRRWIR